MCIFNFKLFWHYISTSFEDFVVTIATEITAKIAKKNYLCEHDQENVYTLYDCIWSIFKWDQKGASSGLQHHNTAKMQWSALQHCTKNSTDHLHSTFSWSVKNHAKKIFIG